MDLLATTKATTYGGLSWSAHAGQRASNSRGTNHVDHRRIIRSPGVRLLRLNSTGEVSSDDKCHNLTRSTSVITTKPQGTASGKIMGYLHSWMPLVGKHLDLQQSQIQYNPENISTLVNVFSSPQKDIMPEGKTFETYFANDGSKSNIISKAMNMPIFPPQTQSLVLNRFNQHILKNSCKKEEDMSSPWNRFYANWKESNHPDFTMGWKNKLSGENLTVDKKQLLQNLPNSLEEKSLFGKTVDKSILNVYIVKQTDSNDSETKMKSGCNGKVMVKDKVNPIRIQSTCISLDPMLIIPCTENPVVQTDKNINTDSQNGINVPQHSCDKTDITKKSGVLNVGEIDISVCNLDTTNPNWALQLNNDRCSKKSRRNKISAKRQRRLKSRRRQNCSNVSPKSSANSDFLEDKINSTDTDQHAASHSASSDNGQKSASNPVSFIVGISEFDEASSHKEYRVSMVVDCEDSAFSEDDHDGDSDCFDFSDFSYRCDFLPNGGDLFNPLNFTVSISMSPSTPEHNVPLSPLFPTNSNLKDINDCWKTLISSPMCKSKSSKKVSFAPEQELAVVHPMVAWSYAYRSARKGPWEEYARDRQRFQRRVEETEVLLNSIFQPNHRSIAFQRQAANCEL